MGMGLRLPKSEGRGGRGHGRHGIPAPASTKTQKKTLSSAAWKEAKALIWARRGGWGSVWR